MWADDQNPITEMPAVNTDETSYSLVEMRGVAIDDPKWDDYINQFTVESMAKMFSNGGWNELADTDNGVPISYDADSPYGLLRRYAEKSASMPITSGTAALPWSPQPGTWKLPTNWATPSLRKPGSSNRRTASPSPACTATA